MASPFSRALVCDGAHMFCSGVRPSVQRLMSIQQVGLLHTRTGRKRLCRRNVTIGGQAAIICCTLEAQFVQAAAALNFSGDAIQRVFEDVDCYRALSPIVGVGSSASELYESFPMSERVRFTIIAVSVWLYLTRRPGILCGAIDAYLLAPVQKLLDGVRGRGNWKHTNFVIGSRIGEGSFGTVYRGVLLPPQLEVEQKLGRRTRQIEEFADSKRFQKVILKKVKVGVQGADECGDMEEWFNYRVRRAAPDACAEFLGSFVSDITFGNFIEGGKWLIWKYEGDSTLADFMKQRTFPENLGEVLLGRRLTEKDPTKRSAMIIKEVLQQLIRSLNKIHSSGVVHRDIKPSNLMITNRGKVKIIDFGAATDLRVGKNYIPDRGMLDPDYCPPELYVLPDSTPKPPPEPVAAVLSPFVWQLNHPDLYDMYSVGIILLQMAVTNLRTPVGLKVFKSEIALAGYDLQKWRTNTKLGLGECVLDLDNGKGWDLANNLICRRGIFFFNPRRLSATAALRHPYLCRSLISVF